MCTEGLERISLAVHFAVSQTERPFFTPFCWKKDTSERKKNFLGTAILTVPGSSAYFHKSTLRLLPIKKSPNIRHGSYSGNCTKKLSTQCWSSTRSSIWNSGESYCEIKSINSVAPRLQGLWHLPTITLSTWEQISIMRTLSSLNFSVERICITHRSCFLSQA